MKGIARLFPLPGGMLFSMPHMARIGFKRIALYERPTNPHNEPPFGLASVKRYGLWEVSTRETPLYPVSISRKIQETAGIRDTGGAKSTTMGGVDRYYWVSVFPIWPPNLIST